MNSEFHFDVSLEDEKVKAGLDASSEFPYDFQVLF